MIVRVLESRPEFNGHLGRVRELPDVWQERLLVVEGGEMLADVIKAIVSGEGAVDTASDGVTGLESLRERHYSAIITGVDMPGMNGIEFYRKALEEWPDIGSRFIFFTGTADEWAIPFLKENNLRYLQRPSSIRLIRDTVISAVLGA
jgi:two-component system response regulator YesN